MIEKKYNNKISSFLLDIKLLNYNRFKTQQASIYFLLNSSETNIEKVTSFANNNQILTFAYDSIFLKNGVSFSLAIDKTAKPFANLKALKKAGIKLRPVVLRISKAYVK
jgi:virulence-associated protein VapD